MMKNIIRDKKGVFGLNAVQSFFAIILSIALLAYIIVIIMGTLSSAGNTSILPRTSPATIVNETVTFSVTNAPQTLHASTHTGGACGVLTQVTNATNVGTVIGLTNFTQTGCELVNATPYFVSAGTNVVNLSYTQLVSYTYTEYSTAQNQLDGILNNVSTGVTGFFNSINPVYAILAVLVIILVLVVLVRVVQAPNREESRTSL